MARSVKRKAIRKRKAKRRSHLANVILKTVQSDMFLRIGKSLLAIKILSESLANHRKKNWSHALEQSLQGIRASQNRVSAVFNPLIYRLYPESVDKIAQFIDNITSACARLKLPSNLLNEIQLPHIQLEGRNDENKEGNAEGRDKPDIQKRLSSREYFLLLSSIYLNESMEEMQMIFQDEIGIRTLVKVLRRHVAEIENCASEIYKRRISHKRLVVPKVWGWTSNLKIPSAIHVR